MERLRRFRGPAAKVAGAVIVLAGVAEAGVFLQTPSQVNNVRLVDCNNGPKQGELIVNLPTGANLDLSGEDGRAFIPHLKLTSENGHLQVGTSSGTLDIKADGTVENGNVTINPHDGIIFQSGRIDYNVTSSPLSGGVTKVDVKASCVANK